MKKLLSLTLSLLFMILCGCNSNSPEVTAITKGLKFTAKIEYNNENYEFKVKIPESSEIIMQAVSPKRIKDSIFEFSGNGVIFRLGELEYQSSITALPEISPASLIYNVFSDVSKNANNITFKDDEYFISGETSNYKYKLFVGTSGLPIKITDSKNNLTAIIKGSSII